MNAAKQYEPRSSAANAHRAVQKSAMTSLWEAVDLCLLREGINSSITSEKWPSPLDKPTEEAARKTAVVGDIVVGSVGGNNEDEDSDQILKSKQAGQILTSAEKRPCENDDAHDRDYSDSDPDSDGEGGKEAFDGEEGDEDAEYCEENSSDDEYKTDNDCNDSSSQDDDTLSRCSMASVANCEESQHELFLPCDVSPSTESLKYEESNESSGEEDDASHDSSSDPPYKIGNRSNGQPLLWDGCPSGISASSASDSSSDETRRPNGSGDAKPSKGGGISFSNSVTVYPVFKTDVYPPSVVESMYTGRKELRQNRIRNLREYTHDKRDWRNATEEDDMDFNEEGELVHPVHQPECSKRNVVQIHPPSHLRGADSPQSGRGGKRMRMWYS